MEEPEPRLELSRYREILARRGGLILVFCLSASLSSLALTYIFSEKYVAYTTVLYRPKEAVRFQLKQPEAMGFPPPFVTYESIGNTLEELARSDAIARQVVQILGLDRPAPKRPGWRGLLISTKQGLKKLAGKAWQMLKYGRTIEEEPFSAAVRKLQENTAIKPTKKAYTFRLVALDDDPQRAATIVDTQARVLADFLSGENVRSAQQEKEQLAVRLTQNQREVAEARAALAQFKKTSRISSLAEETSLQLKAVANLEEELAQTQIDLRATERKRDELRARLAREQPLVKYQSTTSDNPVVQEMKLELARLQVQRAGLLEKFTPEYQEVKALDARLQEVRAKLNSEVGKIVSSESTRLSDVYQKVTADEASAEADVEAAEARRRSVAGAISRSKAGMKTLDQNQSRLAELTLHLDVAERSYKLLSDAYEEARIAEGRSASEVAVLHPALVPAAPERPIKILHVAVSGIMGLFLAVGYFVFLSYFDSSLRNLEDAKRILKLPVLTAIPSFGTQEPHWDCCIESNP